MTLIQWWHVESAPTADEWQAIASMLTLAVAIAGVFFALRQLRQGSHQLKLAAEANVRAAEAAEAEARPYVSIRLDLRSLPPADPKTSGGGEGLVFIVVESVGRTPAREISFTVSPAFVTSGRGKPADGTDPVADTLTAMFSGKPVIGMLSAGQSLDYMLDFAKEALDSTTGGPQHYDVTASYWDATREHHYSEPHILDLTPWAHSIMTAKPIDVIARQMRRLNQNLEASKD
ncbi:hypothetical protein NQ152_00185 [Microbacterium sp. zg.B48]|uniref:hypothetical protein n=1 Tax=Microbacterium sp. zg.B48 TaxID=2969408 RepID=UPI00214B6F7E|nr:hypothetical protein [Microbacterium sp. zg.B48]MCR2761921.1 hypothetical protein [Microbacterium sp. zg.B48]